MSEKIELSKEQMIAVKKGHIENDICGGLAAPFAQLMRREIWLWHDTIKGVCRSIKSQEVRDKVDKFVLEAYNVSGDKTITNVKLKNAQIIKLWIEGISLCFDEMAEDYDVLRDVFANDNTYFAIDQISQTTYDDFISLTDRIKKYYKESEDAQFVSYIHDKVQEANDLYQMYSNKSLSVIYKLKMIKIIIEVLCSCFIFFEEKDFDD